MRNKQNLILIGAIIVAMYVLYKSIKILFSLLSQIVNNPLNSLGIILISFLIVFILNKIIFPKQ